jgi:hypothetical protein
VRLYAKPKCGKCLSDNYHSTSDILEWQCDKGHVWNSNFHEIKKGHWCPICANENKRIYNIKYCQELAAKHFGKCISEEYKDTKTKLTWVCELGHIWDATLGNVKDNGSWCPECSQSYGENKFREVIENISGYKFPKVRPCWLLNRRGNRMEIDGFCLELNIGFEYQGRQHSEFITHWHKRKKVFNQQQDSDALKKKILESRGIQMLYPTHELKPSQFEKFIVDKIPMMVS